MILKLKIKLIKCRKNFVYFVFLNFNSKNKNEWRVIKYYYYIMENVLLNFKMCN